MAVVLKTTEPEKVPGVRIPLSPPAFAQRSLRSLATAGGPAVLRAFREGCPSEPRAEGSVFLRRAEIVSPPTIPTRPTILTIPTIP